MMVVTEFPDNGFQCLGSVFIFSGIMIQSYYPIRSRNVLKDIIRCEFPCLVERLSRCRSKPSPNLIKCLNNLCGEVFCQAAFLFRNFHSFLKNEMYSFCTQSVQISRSSGNLQNRCASPDYKPQFLKLSKTLF